MKKEEKPVKFGTVLLIDDNDIDNFINERMITTSGFASKVIVKNSAEGALEYLRSAAAGEASQLPEIIFLDLNMPVMDGFGFLEAYDKLDAAVKERCHVVVLSSSISSEDINRASTNPYVTRYVNKPLSEKYLDAISF